MTRQGPVNNGVGTRKRRGVSECTPAQRERIRDTWCINCGSPQNLTPAHVIPRSLTTKAQAEDPRAVIALCLECHRMYDEGDLDLLPALAHIKDSQAWAVEAVGIARAYKIISNGGAA